jgi:ribosomal protein L37AE/L43A
MAAFLNQNRVFNALFLIGDKIMRPNTCPCCGNILLRHARQGGIYWFCTSCYQEMTPLMSDRSLTQEVLGGRSRTPQTLNT